MGRVICLGTGDPSDAERVQTSLAVRLAGEVPALLDPSSGTILLGRLREAGIPVEKDSAPTLVIGGTEDPYFSEDLLYETAEKIPDATLRIYGGVGHGVPKERKRRYEKTRSSFWPVASEAGPAYPARRPRHGLRKRDDPFVVAGRMAPTGAPVLPWMQRPDAAAARSSGVI